MSDVIYRIYDEETALLIADKTHTEQSRVERSSSSSKTAMFALAAASVLALLAYSTVPVALETTEEAFAMQQPMSLSSVSAFSGTSTTYSTKDVKDGDIKWLNKHSLNCSGTPLQGFQMVSAGVGTQVHMNYQCLSSLAGPLTASWAYNTGLQTFGPSLTYLDKQHAMCPDNSVMSYARGMALYYSFGNRFTYNYICSAYQVLAYKCVTRVTEWTTPGNDGSLLALTKHAVACPGSSAIKGFKYQTNYVDFWTPMIRVQYTCCTADSLNPTSSPVALPTKAPVADLTATPTVRPNASPSALPTLEPIAEPSTAPVALPTDSPVASPSQSPVADSTEAPTTAPVSDPTASPTLSPVALPTALPSVEPVASPSHYPSPEPSPEPSREPSANPTTLSPVSDPTPSPTFLPIAHPSNPPTLEPSQSPEALTEPTGEPVPNPTNPPTVEPTEFPVADSTEAPSPFPVAKSTHAPTTEPVARPTEVPIAKPSFAPSREPTAKPSFSPSAEPSAEPSSHPIAHPTKQPSFEPTTQPISTPTTNPSQKPSYEPTAAPSESPVSSPTYEPTKQPTPLPSYQPSNEPISQPTIQPSNEPISEPTLSPTVEPTLSPNLPDPPSDLTEAAKTVVLQAKLAISEPLEAPAQPIVVTPGAPNSDVPATPPDSPLAVEIGTQEAAANDITNPNAITPVYVSTPVYIQQPATNESAIPDAAALAAIVPSFKSCPFLFKRTPLHIQVPLGCLLVSASKLDRLPVGTTAPAAYLCSRNASLAGIFFDFNALSGAGLIPGGKTNDGISYLRPGVATSATFFQGHNFEAPSYTFTSGYHPDLTNIHYSGLPRVNINDNINSIVLKSTASSIELPPECSSS